VQQCGAILALSSVVGADHVMTDLAVISGYLTDWTGRYTGEAMCVVRPGSTAQVREVLRTCREEGIAVVPQGGNTGLVGGSIPQDTGKCVVLSMTRMDSVIESDFELGKVTVEAGVTLAQLQMHLKNSGWEFGVDLAARDSATIGGTVATNAGGIHVVGNGMMRKQVLGLEAVLASGEVIRSMSGLAKNNTGYDLTQLFCGSEGTLGVITEVSLQLVRPRETELVLAGCESVQQALEIASGFTGKLVAAELMDRSGIECVSRVTAVAIPFTTPFHLLIEITGDIDLEQLESLEHATLAMDARDRENFWALRERITESAASEATGVSHKLDISVPLSELDSIYGDITSLLHQPEVRNVVLFGHLMDGNFHVSFVTDTDNETLDIAVLELVAARGGSISAEHGVGHMKPEHLHLSRSRAEIAAMRAIKIALDPAGMLNPGVLLPKD